jgi:leader peptidase (prepilin peptidase) / N-methyltransferase
MPVVAKPVRYRADVDVLLVAGTALVGVAVGGVLDPVGQQLADASAAAEAARRSKEATTEEPLPSGVDPPVATRVVHLLPPGGSTARTAGAALATGVLFGSAALRFGWHVILAPYCVFFAMLVTIAVTDLTHRLVPRRLVYGGMALIVPLLVVTAGQAGTWHDLLGSVVAGALAFGLFFAVWWFVPRGMGFGDVRLAGAIGFTVGYLSLLHAYLAFLAGFVVGMLFGLAVIAVSSSGRRTRIPFAPSLGAGAVIAVLWGGHLAHGLFHSGS